MPVSEPAGAAATAAGATAPRPAKGARADELLELVGHLRRELARRGESVSVDWADGVVSDLRSGALAGWYTPPAHGEGGVAFFSVRPRRAYGHVHVEPGAGAGDRALALVRALVDGLPPSVARLDLGLTGLTEDEEVSLRPALSEVPGGSVNPRWGLDRPLLREDAVEPTLPSGFSRVPIASVAPDSLQALDRVAFGTTPDSTLLADTPEENRRVIEEILEGRLGLFLEEASIALASEDGHLVGAVLTAQETPQRGIFVDLAVAPDYQRRGLARYLLRFGYRALLALGYTTATLWVSESNVGARALYAEEGFQPTRGSTLFTYVRPEGRQPQTSR